MKAATSSANLQYTKLNIPKCTAEMFPSPTDARDRPTVGTLYLLIKSKILKTAELAIKHVIRRELMSY
jgi:hypothetical protein